MNCKNCGKPVPAGSKFCPECGAPVEADPEIQAAPPKKSGLVKGLEIFICIMLVIAVGCFAIGFSSDPAPASPATKEVAQDQQVQAVEAPAVAPTEAPTEEVSSYFTDGMYKVGSEVPAGEYFLIASKGFPAYYQVATDSTGEFDSIVTNDNVETFSFFTVDAGQYLTVNRGKFIEVSEASVPGPDADGNYGAGMYRVGIDIPAGEYKVTATEAFPGYIQVSTNSYGGLEGIVSNENFETSMYITVSDGQYLTVNRGEFRPA